MDFWCDLLRSIPYLLLRYLTVDLCRQIFPTCATVHPVCHRQWWTDDIRTNGHLLRLCRSTRRGCRHQFPEADRRRIWIGIRRATTTDRLRLFTRRRRSIERMRRRRLAVACVWCRRRGSSTEDLLTLLGLGRSLPCLRRTSEVCIGTSHTARTWGRQVTTRAQFLFNQSSVFELLQVGPAPFSQMDIIEATVIVWWVRGKIIRSVLHSSCARCNARTFKLA